jgi:hypothetical protein
MPSRSPQLIILPLSFSLICQKGVTKVVHAGIPAGLLKNPCPTRNYPDTFTELQIPYRVKDVMGERAGLEFHQSGGKLDVDWRSGGN